MKSLRGLLICLLCLGMVSLARAAQAAPLTDTGECNPFNPDGTVKSSRECVCSQLPAEVNYCMDPTEYLQLKIGQKAGLGLLSAVENFTGLLWFIERMAVNFAQFALSGQVWTQIREAILGLLAEILGGSGGVLDLIIRGPNGLFYLALVMAGLMMIIPFALFGQRPVKLERVFVWGVFILALFVGSTQGFDLIGKLEALRVGLMQTILRGETLDLGTLVGAPMKASSTETLTIEELQPLNLPAAFANTYFPDRETLDEWQFRVRVPTPLNNVIDVIFPGTLFTEEAMDMTTSQAVGGVLLAILTLIPAAVLFLMGVVLMLLTAAALVLIIFFVAALPLGFFEFGVTILGGIVRQYLGIVMLSLFTAIFMRILAALGVGIFGDDFTLTGMVFYLGGLGLVIIALQAALRQAWKALDGSLGIVQNAFVPVFTSIGNLAYTQGPMGEAVEGGKEKVNSAVQAATMLTAGAVTGGGSLLAALPGLIQDTSDPKAGQIAPEGDLQAVAAAFPSAATPQQGAFAPPGQTPTGASQPASPASTLPATRLVQHHQDRQPPVQPPGTRPLALETPHWDYVTPERSLFDEAEKAFFDAGDETAAQQHLAYGLGSIRLAEAVLDIYRTRGRKGSREIRNVVALTQDTATRQSGAIAITEGHLTAQFLEDLHAAFAQAGLPQPKGLTSEIAQASLRQIVPVHTLPEQADILAYAVAEVNDPMVQIEDAAAQYRLHDLAEKLAWGGDKLKTLFSQYERALQDAQRTGQPVQSALTARLQADPAFTHDSVYTRNEAARLAVLVGEKAWMQLPVEAAPEAGAQTPSRPCAYCGTQNPDTAPNCSKCGAPFTPQPTSAGPPDPAARQESPPAATPRPERDTVSIPLDPDASEPPAPPPSREAGDLLSELLETTQETTPPPPLASTPSAALMHPPATVAQVPTQPSPSHPAPLPMPPPSALGSQKR